MPTEEGCPVKPGDVLAHKYRVDAVLGVGGMGVVVSATHLQLDQRFALKFMLPWALGDKAAVERFAREARAAVRLKSVHAARVVDVGTLDTGSPFMVMEFLEGSDLADVVEGHKKLGVAEAADYILQACDAVAEAHELGIIHRDLKPRNLFRVTGHDGNPLIKVLDFGISKISGATDLALTKTTEVIGSPSYMSPEQLRSSRDVDERTDIWALGVILYELLGGVVPFDARTVMQLTAMVLLDNPRPIREIRPDVPVEIERLIARCLEKDPLVRLQGVADIADVLDAFVPEHSKGLARRIRQVRETQGGRSVPPPSGVALGSHPQSNSGGYPPNPQSRVPVTGGTSVSWSKTELAAGSSSVRRLNSDAPPAPPLPQTGPRWGLVALFMLLGTSVGVALVFVYARTGPSAAPTVGAPGDSVSAVASPAPSPAASAAPASSSATGASPAIPAPVPVADTPPAKPTKARTPPRAGRDAASATAAPASDDIPIDRH